MFDSKAEKIEKLVLKGKWDDLGNKYLNSDTETRLILAQECSKSTDYNVNNLLSILMRDTDEKVKLAAIKSIGITGKDHECAQLEWLMSNTPEDKKEIITALQDSISKVRRKK